MMQTIEALSPEGETKVQTKGFTGAACLEASRFLETALGVAGAEQKTAEFYHVALAQQQVQQ